MWMGKGGESVFMGQRKKKFTEGNFGDLKGGL